MNYCKYLKQIREELFLSQEELAKLLGVSVVTVNRWETGKFKPSIKSKRIIYEFSIKHNINFIKEKRYE